MAHNRRRRAVISVERVFLGSLMSIAGWIIERRVIIAMKKKDERSPIEVHW